MKQIAVSVVAIALVFAAVPARAQGDDFSKVEIKPTKVAGSIWMLAGSRGQHRRLGRARRPADRRRPVPPARRQDQGRAQGDLTRREARVRRQHPLARRSHRRQSRVREGRDDHRADQRQEAPRRASRIGAAAGRRAVPKEALPVVTFENGVTIWFNGEEIEIVHVPHGHTDGDAIVFFKGSNVVHMGDQFFNGTFPFIDIARAATSPATSRTSAT